LSAFSNSIGGLILWGIVARKDDDGVDCATDRQPIANIERFKADVTRLISQAVMPRHEGILVEAIPVLEPLGAGYLAIYVERSERRPHRCEFTKQYWKRSGDSSIMMEHYDIEDSFKRLVVPWLEIKWEVQYASRIIGSAERLYTVQIDILLRNPSPVTARFPFLAVQRQLS
jgi:predicted HTH transcriptional regulator